MTREYRREDLEKPQTIAFVILIVIWTIVLLTAAMHTYGDVTTPNAGVWWNLPGHHWCGFEYKGHPGFFCDVT